MFFINISALHISGGFSAHHQELIKLRVQPSVLSCFPAIYRWYGWVGTVQLKLNIYSGDNNKEYCINIISFFDVFLTVHHSLELFHLPTLMHNSLFINPLAPEFSFKL
jgi:hypothetical protein